MDDDPLQSLVPRIFSKVFLRKHPRVFKRITYMCMSRNHILTYSVVENILILNKFSWKKEVTF